MNKYLKNLIYFLPIPFVINFLSNLSSISHVNLQSILLFSIHFCFIWDEINKILNLNSISLSISIYLMGLFIINFIFLPIDKYFLSFSDILIIYNLFVGLYCLYFQNPKIKYSLFLDLYFY